MPKKSTGLLRRRRFRKRDLLFVAALFSLVGMLAIISTFAATFTTVEAGTLKYNKVANIAGQNGGRAAAMYWGATGTGNVSLPTKTTSVTVYARGDQCQGAPQMTLTIDGQQVANQAVTATGWKAYTVPVNIEAGSHALAVGFTNDAVVANGNKNNVTTYCDRNLYVDRLVFTGLDKPATLSTNVEAEIMSSNLSQVVDGSVKDGKARAFYQNATASTGVILPNAVNQIKLVAKGDQCQGAPNVKVTVDGKSVVSRAVTGRNWGEYVSTVNIPAGSHKVGIEFTNDVYIAATRCDRNLYVDRLVLTGPAPAPKPPVAQPAASKPPTPTVPTTPAAQSVATYSPTAPYTIIMIGWRPYEKEYAQLANTKTNLVYRSIERTPNGQGKWPKLDQWEAANYRYYNNVAGSDWASSGAGGACKNINLAYMDQRYSDELLQRKGNIGYYMHEMVALNAACNGWNWTAAAQSIDWARINNWMLQAKAQNKKVIWSEPAQGWNAIRSNPTFQAVAPYWKESMVPMFATNFRTPSFNHVPYARDGATAVARQFGTPVGESVQSWYFREGYNDLTTSATVGLANYGLEVGSTYYQIEGTYGDMAWGTDYMKGILAFSKTLGPAGSPVPAPVVVVPPVAASQSTVAKKPLYQLWNNVTSDHMYTTSETEKNQLIATKGYVDQGIAGYVYEKSVPGSVPLYRLYSANLTDHFYTNSETQRSQAKAGGGRYVDEGITGYVMTSQVSGTTPLYQLYSGGYPDHFYTTQTWSRDSAKASFRKYVEQGNAGYVFVKP
ncbi:hypothetical protein EPO04_00370 [Patescibacteria group bacterium]|nr:MAG: hypothetical protein EPO04_00370 [Patescibacteria group bacterium]